MKNIILITISLIALIAYFSFLEVRDTKLMALCANHETQTLYECE